MLNLGDLYGRYATTSDGSIRRPPFVLKFCLGLLSLSLAGASVACEAKPTAGGKCSALQGRVYLSNGTPSMRISPNGSQRVLGVLPPENEDAPESIKKIVTFDHSAVANLELCPLTSERKGEMQMVCIRRASNIVLTSH